LGEERRVAYRVLVERTNGKNQLGKRTRRWKNNIKIYFKEVGWGGMDWIDLVRDKDIWRALVNVEMKFRIQISAGKFFTGY
jgi:hypothetical protein